MTIGDRIKMLRKSLGMSAEDLAAKLGKDRSTIYRYENNFIENVPSVILEQISNALNTTPAFLLGYEKLPDNLIPIRQAHFRPVLGCIACGTPILAEQNIETYIPVPHEIRCDFVLRCSGDSMDGAGIHDGDLVYVRKQDDVNDGEIAAVLFLDGDSTATLKRVYHSNGQLTLMPSNPSHSPIIVSGDDLSSVRILGLAVAVTSRL